MVKGAQEGGRRPKTLRGDLGATPPLAAGPRRGWGAAPLASYIKGGLGRAAAPVYAPPRCPSRHPPPPSPPPAPPLSPEGCRHHLHHSCCTTPSRRAAAPCPPIPLLLLGLAKPCSWRLHHQRHHNRRGAEIHLAISTLLAGSRSWRSTSSLTCGYRGGAAHAVLHRIGSRG